MPIGMVIALALAIQFLSRFATSPVTDFTCDDWALLERAQACPSYADVWRFCLQETDRPLQAGVLSATFRLFGDRPWLYGLLSWVAYSVHLSLLVLIAWKLTSSRTAALLSGLLFALLPNLTESFHWGAMVTVAYMQVAYVGSALAWILYVERRRAGWLMLSTFLFAIGLTTYEFGIGLPVVFGALLLDRKDRGRLWSLSPFLAVIALYLLWRFTHGFGMAHGVLFTPRRLELSPGLIAWNAREVVRWWAGGHMMEAIQAGLGAFLTLPPPSQHLLVVVNVFAIALLVAAIRNVSRSETRLPAPGMAARAVWFGAAWFAAGHALNLISWTAGRLNFFPAIGLALAAGALLSRTDTRRWIPALVAIALLCLPVNQGTAVSWRQSGLLQRRLYEHLRQTEREWRAKPILLVDTRALRQRLTPGLTTEPRTDPSAWAYYGNASLLRGFVPRAMVSLVNPAGPNPQTLLDVEHGAEIVDGRMKWHDRWDDSARHETPTADVFRVDCFLVGTGAQD